MKSDYREIGDFIKQSKLKNEDGCIDRLLGVNLDKKFMPSVANLNGVDLTKYKVIKKGQFGCKLMSVGRDKRVPISRLTSHHEAIISSAYYVFEVIDESELDPQYLMMWFSRSESDRFQWFQSGADIRGRITWEEFCSLPIKVPPIERQREIVQEYNTVINRIDYNENLIKKLEEVGESIFRKYFVEEHDQSWTIKELNDLCSLITDGKHGDCENEADSGYYFLSAKDVRNNTLIYSDARQITQSDFNETHRRTNLKEGDICMINTGATIGRMAITPDDPKTSKTTFQKSVAILKPRKGVTKSSYLFYLLKANLREIVDLASGTSQANLLLGDLRAFQVEYPGESKVNEFESLVKPINKYQFVLTKQNDRLWELSSLLLAKMSHVIESTKSEQLL